MLTEERDQLLPVRGTTDLVADRVQLQLDPRQPETAKERVTHRDHLRVGAGILRAEHLDAELPVLPVAALLGRAYRYIRVR